MAETLALTPGASRRDRYAELLPQVRALIDAEPDTIATLANVAAALQMAFGFHWVGFYLVQGDDLVLGPFQGPLACTRIPRGRGVCGSAWARAATLVVPDVHRFPGHIACSAASVSEIVVPLRDAAGVVWAVLDIDSVAADDFSEVDQAALEQVADWLRGHRPPPP
ncbi:MAG: GAF domain-containing protein [Planctomycetaceae bacterium]